MIYRISASDAKERQKWIDKLRTCSGSNAASVVNMNNFFEKMTFSVIVKYVSSLPIPKGHTANTSPLANSPNETHFRSSHRRESKYEI
jgi:hypothetical protein